MHPVFHGVVFRRQTKRVPPDGIQHIVALHAALARYYVNGGVAARMPHMQSRARRIGKLYKPVKLGKSIILLGLEGLLLFPYVLPLLFDL